MLNDSNINSDEVPLALTSTDRTANAQSDNPGFIQLVHGIRMFTNNMKNPNEDQDAAFKSINEFKENDKARKKEMDDLRAKNEELAESKCGRNEKIAKLESENASLREHNDSTTRRNDMDSVAGESTDVLGLIGCMYGWRNLCCSCVGQPCVLLVSSLEVLSRAHLSSKPGEANQVYY